MLDLTVKFEREDREGALNKTGKKNTQFSANHISETVQDRAKVTIND